jgi:hypothetical protein
VCESLSRDRYKPWYEAGTHDGQQGDSEVTVEAVALLYSSEIVVKVSKKGFFVHGNCEKSFSEKPTYQDLRFVKWDGCGPTLPEKTDTPYTLS